MSKRCELQKEYYQQYGNYKGNGKYCDKYVSWLENEVLALRQPPVSGRSELLLAFWDWYCEEDNVDNKYTANEMINAFLASNIH